MQVIVTKCREQRRGEVREGAGPGPRRATLAIPSISLFVLRAEEVIKAKQAMSISFWQDHSGFHVERRFQGARMYRRRAVGRRLWTTSEEVMPT